MMRLTESEIVKALREAMERTENDEGLSVRDMAEILGVRDKRRIREAIAREIRAGRMLVGRKWDKAMDGTVRHVPVYRIKT